MVGIIENEELGIDDATRQTNDSAIDRRMRRERGGLRSERSGG
jgi:hypothetical protein